MILCMKEYLLCQKNWQWPLLFLYLLRDLPGIQFCFIELDKIIHLSTNFTFSEVIMHLQIHHLPTILKL